MLRRFWCIETGIFLALWIALMVFGRSMLFRDPGTFWHTVAGRQMLESGRVVRADSLSFTRAKKPWTAHQWLAECGMAVLHRFGQWDALLLAAATLLAGVYSWLAHRLLRAGLHLLPALLLVALALMAGSPQFHVRPLIVTLAFLGVSFALLVDVEAGRAKLRRLAWLVPLVVLWANLHAGVLAGIGTVGLVAAGWSAAWLLGKGDPPVRRLRDVFALAALLLLLCAAVLVNPYGVDLPKAWLNTLAIPLPDLIQEHARVNLAEPLGWTVLLLGFGYAAVLLGALPKRLHVTWLVPLVWLVLALQRVRNVPLFAVTVVIAFADVLPRSRPAKWLERREMYRPPGEKEQGTCDPRSAVLPLVLILAAAMLISRGDWVEFDAARWPVGLLPELAEIDRTSPDGTPIFNDLKFGGFVIYHAPRLRVFVDDRCALYGAEFLAAYDRARREDPRQIDLWQRQYGFRHALVETGKAFDRYLAESPEWDVVKRTPAGVLYRRAE